jgi:hypothetical protein
MADPISRRAFAAASAGVIMGTASNLPAAEDRPAGPTEAVFERDYAAPSFKPSWKKQQINRQFVQDFVIFAHSDLEMTKILVEKEPAVLNGFMDWGAGDWESGLGGASHMGRKDIVAFLLEKGARIDIFCAAMMGQLDAVKGFLTLQPKLIDARGPHGFNLHFHAQVGGKEAEPVLDYLQSVKKIEMKPNPFLQKPGEVKKPG